MRIVYLDQPSYFPEYARARLESLGDLVVFEDKPDAVTARRRLESADVAIVEWTTLDAEILDGLSQLQCIVLVTTSFSFVDVAAARANGITVCNSPDYSRQSVAEHVFAMFLSLSKRLIEADAVARRGEEYTSHEVGRELFAATLGVVGVGSIGSCVARIGRGFGMEVLGASRRDFDVTGVKNVPLDALLASSDFIALTLSVNESSRGLLDQRRLRLLKRGSILVNIAGNSVLDSDFVASLLADGHLFGAGFDLTPADSLMRAPHVQLSPGTAWYTQASLDRNAEMFTGTVAAFLNGSPRYVVN